MINQIDRTFSFSPEQERHITTIPDTQKPQEWDRRTTMMISIKESITKQLDMIQHQKCCYCGLQLWETGRGEIDHIAPKASRQKAYPEFTFLKQNLALACEYCNGSSKKGETNTILRYHNSYPSCEFKIVHPYFDNPSDHYEWINERTKIVIRHRTWKGKYSIILFHLKEQAFARAKQRMHEKRVNRIRRVSNLFNRFKEIVSFHN